MLSAQVPPEIVEAIIDAAGDSQETLRSLTQVAHGFRFRSQYNLFSRFKITLPSESLEPLLHHFIVNPRFAGYVQSLEIVLQTQTEEMYTQTLLSRGSTVTRMADFTVSFILERMLRMFHSLRSLSVTRDDLDLDLDDNHNFRQRRYTLVSLEGMCKQRLRLNNLREFKVYGVERFPVVAVLSQCAQPIRLTLYLSHFKSMQWRPVEWKEIMKSYIDVTAQYLELGKPSKAITDPSKIETLSIDEDFTLVAIDLYQRSVTPGCRFPITFKHLRELTVRNGVVPMWPLVNDIMDAAAGALVKFTWDNNVAPYFTDDFASSMPPLILPSSLRSIRISSFYGKRAHVMDPVFEHPAIAWLIRVLKQGSTVNLEELVLVISVMSVGQFEDPSEMWDPASEWAATLDALLTGGAYPCLQRVSIIVDCPEKSDALLSLVDQFLNLSQTYIITLHVTAPNDVDLYVLNSV